MSNKQSQNEESMSSNNNFLELIHTLFQQMEKKIDRKLETMKLQHQMIHPPMQHSPKPPWHSIQPWTLPIPKPQMIPQMN